MKQQSPRGRRRMQAAFAEQAARCRKLPCCVCAWLRRVQSTPTEAHHEPPRSRGGIDKDTVPLCRGCHATRHAKGVETFWREAGVELAAVLEAVRLGTALPGDPWGHVPF